MASNTTAPEELIATPWVVLRGTVDKWIVVACTECYVKLLMPEGISAPRADELIGGFCVDHQGCKKERTK